MKSAPAFSV